MQITSKPQGAGRTSSPAASSAGAGLTVIGIATQGQFFREHVSYSLDDDGFHFLSKHCIAEQASVLIEIAKPNPNELPSRIQAKVISSQPSSTSPGMFELIVQKEGANAPVRQMPNASAPVSTAPAAPAPPAKVAVDAPGIKVTPAPSAAALPVVPPPVPRAVAPPVVPPPAPPVVAPPKAIPQLKVSATVSPVTEKDIQMIRDTVARAVASEVESVLQKLERHLPVAAQKSLDAAAGPYVEKFVREQLSSRLQSQTEAMLRQGLEELTRSLGEASGHLRKRADGEFEQIAGEYREKLRQALERDLEGSQAQAASTATQLEQLRAQAAKEFEEHKAELRDLAVSFQSSNAQSAAAAAEETRKGILAQIDAEMKAIQDRTEMAAQSVLEKLSAEADNIASRIFARPDADFQAKAAAAQFAVDVHLDQSKIRVAELLSQLETSRAEGLSSAAELSNALAQMDMLRQNLKAEMAAADGWLAKAMQDAMTRLSAQADLRIVDGSLQIDSDLQTKQAAFQKFVSQQLDAARGQAAGILDNLEACRTSALQSLHTVDTAHQTIDQLREAWQAEMRAEETKLRDMTRRVQSSAAAETTRLLNKAMGSFDEKLRGRISEVESSCDGIAAHAAQQLETSAARLKKTETATAALLADVDASLNRSTQTLDALNELQASLTSNFQQMLTAEMENLAVLSKKQLDEQCKRMVALHVSALEKQAALHVQAAEQSLQRFSEEQKGAEAACRVHRESLHVESKKAMEEFRSGVAQTTDRLKAEVENATRQAHEALEQEFSLKIKYLADNTTDLVRRLFHRSSE